MFVLQKERCLKRKHKYITIANLKKEFYIITMIKSYPYILFIISLKVNTLSDILAASGSSLSLCAHVEEAFPRVFGSYPWKAYTTFIVPRVLAMFLIQRVLAKSMTNIVQ